jgi:hypothetical protein
MKDTIIQVRNSWSVVANWNRKSVMRTQYNVLESTKGSANAKSGGRRKMKKRKKVIVFTYISTIKASMNLFLPDLNNNRYANVTRSGGRNSTINVRIVRVAMVMVSKLLWSSHSSIGK